MGKTINLCAKIPEELHAQAREEQEELGVTLNEYVKEILEEHFKKKGGKYERKHQNHCISDRG